MPHTSKTDINTLVSGLKSAANALTQSLDEHNRVRPARVEYGPMTTKQEIVAVLMHEVERRYGIAPGEQVERKLVRIFDLMSFEELEQWSMSLLSPQAIEAEWLSLVECLTVHETYFDRDREQLAVISSEILPALIERKHQCGDYRIRLWSAACSSGEEAYNLAMLALIALKNAGFAVERGDGSIVPLPSWSISVLGSDISSQIIRRAKAGVYATLEMGSFRRMDPSLWRFFSDVEYVEGDPAETVSKRVISSVSDLVTFRRHNLIDPFIEAAAFDLILCRNTLIYFGSESKSIVVDNLYRNLGCGGALMLGVTDTATHHGGFVRHQKNGIFWYVKS